MVQAADLPCSVDGIVLNQVSGRLSASHYLVDQDDFCEAHARRRIGSAMGGGLVVLHHVINIHSLGWRNVARTSCSFSLSHQHCRPSCPVPTHGASLCRDYG